MVEEEGSLSIAFNRPLGSILNFVADRDRNRNIDISYSERIEH